MNIIFDKAEPRLQVKDLPEGANLVKIETDPFQFQGSPSEGVMEIGNFHLALIATVTACKTEEIETQVPVMDETTGEQMTIENEPQFTTETQSIVTVLDTKKINLNIL